MAKIYLLGGHDLEMLEIKTLLEGDGFDVRDNNLDWSNAVLDAYIEVLEQNPDAEFVGIELRDRNQISKKYRYTLIDHHNEFSNKPAAILQVAEMLGKEPDRHMRLVAANDSGYIPAMQALSATDEEIAYIRRSDRAAQGVSVTDEMLAEHAISNNLERHGQLLVVKSETSRFAPICDRLYPYHRLIVYTDAEWMYYGDGKVELVAEFAEEIRTGKVFHGGSDNGYIGCEKGAYSEIEIDEFVKQIITNYGND